MLNPSKTILSVAGSDSIGGAGIQADILTGAALGVHVMTALTAVTAQNSIGVLASHPLPPEMLRLQLEAVVADIIPDAVKIGMLPSPLHASVVADFISSHGFSNVVVDPVISSTSGFSLSSGSALSIMKERLFPLASLITPNIPEAEKILQVRIQSSEQRKSACFRLLESARCGAVLLKGGHSEGHIISDLLLMADSDPLSFHEFSHTKINTLNSHGTGCTLSSAIAAYLALGHPLPVAVSMAIDYLQGALLAARDYTFGRLGGHGPVNHFFNHRYL